jgi:hypothetical protein
MVAVPTGAAEEKADAKKETAKRFQNEEVSKQKMTEGTAVCEDCPKRMSGYMPYFGFSCDGCYKRIIKDV